MATSNLPPTSIDEAKQVYEHLTNNQCKPQPGALHFEVTGETRALNFYFPILKMLSDVEIESFYQLVKQIAEHSTFDIQLIGERRETITNQLPKSARYLVAGHLVEVFSFVKIFLNDFFLRRAIFNSIQPLKPFTKMAASWADVTTRHVNVSRSSFRAFLKALMALRRVFVRSSMSWGTCSITSMQAQGPWVERMGCIQD